jgi:hypothetical protein
MAFGFYGLGGVLVNLLAIKFNDYRFFIGLSKVLIILLSLVYFFFIETPFYYYKKKNIKELYHVLAKLCEWNFPKNEVKTVQKNIRKMLRFGDCFDINDESQKLLKTQLSQTIENDLSEDLLSSEVKPKTKKSIFTKKNIKTMVKLLPLYLQLQFIFSLSLIINKSLGIKNIFLSGTLVGLFQTIGYFTGGPIAIAFNRKTINICSSIIICTASGLLTISDLISNMYTPYEERNNGIRVWETGNLISFGVVHDFPGLHPVWNDVHLFHGIVRYSCQSRWDFWVAYVKQSSFRIGNVYHLFDG